MVFRDVWSGSDIVREVEAGLKVADVCRKYGLSSWTVCVWRKKYRGKSVSEDRKRRLKQLVTNLSLDYAALKDLLSKNWG